MRKKIREGRIFWKNRKKEFLERKKKRKERKRGKRGRKGNKKGEKVLKNGEIKYLEKKNLGERKKLEEEEKEKEKQKIRRRKIALRLERIWKEGRKERMKEKRKEISREIDRPCSFQTSLLPKISFPKFLDFEKLFWRFKRFYYFSFEK